MKKFKTLFPLLLLLPTTALAAGFVENSTDDLFTFLARIKDYLLGFAGALAVLFIIIGGLMYVSSAGEPKRIERAKNTLTYAILGLIFVIVSEVVLGILSGTEFINIFK